MELYIPLDGLVDLDKERALLLKRKTKIEELLISIEKKLLNDKFINNAPVKVVEGEKEKEITLKDELEKINSNLGMLS
jgi:valyl-tRNA synthetase